MFVNRCNRLRKGRVPQTLRRVGRQTISYDIGRVKKQSDDNPCPEDGRPADKAGLLTRSRCTPSRPRQWQKSVQLYVELTATGIVPDSHRSSLLIFMPAAAGREPCSVTKVGIIDRISNFATRFYQQKTDNRAPMRLSHKNRVGGRFFFSAPDRFI